MSCRPWPFVDRLLCDLFCFTCFSVAGHVMPTSTIYVVDPLVTRMSPRRWDSSPPTCGSAVAVIPRILFSPLRICSHTASCRLSILLDLLRQQSACNGCLLIFIPSTSSSMFPTILLRLPFRDLRRCEAQSHCHCAIGSSGRIPNRTLLLFV